MKIIPLLVFGVFLLSFRYQQPLDSISLNKHNKRAVFDSIPFWYDEFDYEGLPDPEKWNYAEGGHGWGNGEFQYYTANRLKNTRVENGRLVIEAHKEDFEGNTYTSARLVTKDRQDFEYARIEVRAKLPTGRGTWPAIWMLSSEKKYSPDNWPENGEIDIMEHVGYNPGSVHATVHTYSTLRIPGDNPLTRNMIVPDFNTAFHTYRVDWYPEGIDIFVDYEPYFSFKNSQNGWEEYPFDHPFHLLLNIAVGGGWGGLRGVDDSIFPQRMEVDYVRAYKYLPNE